VRVREPEDGRDQRELRFRRLYQENYQAIQAYVVRRVEDRGDVADVVAEVFTTAWRRLDKVPCPPDDTLWLYGVARRVISGNRRSLRRFRSLMTRLEAGYGGESRGSPQIEADAVHRGLLDAVASLAPGEREALQLVHWERLSHAEAAAVLGCSANAVAIRVHRARAKLREVLGPGPAREAAGASRAVDPAGRSRSASLPTE
jgi:RNA polymerase sigma factor (sigma-70 family)